MTFKNKKVLIYGAGKSGEGAAKLLRDKGAEIYVYDDWSGAAQGFAEKYPYVIPVNTKSFFLLDYIVISPGVPSISPALLEARLNGVQLISEIELAATFLQAELIGVTGTNGKTTVTMLVAETLKEAGFCAEVAGNIGIPLSDCTDRLKENDVVVAEVSSFQLENIKYFAPDSAVLLNLEPDHLDRYDSAEDYYSAKLRIFERQSQNDRAILNSSDEKVLRLTQSIRAEKIYFSVTGKADAYAENGRLYWRGKKVVEQDKLFSTHPHNLANSLACIAVCAPRDVPICCIERVLKKFSPPKYRVEYVGKLSGKCVYNDSKGTNIAATLAAARAMRGSTLLILGGYGKGEDYGRLFRALPPNMSDILVTGANAHTIIQAAIELGFDNIRHRATLEECVDYAEKCAADSILYSPASASFDSYVDYEERGRYFNKLLSSRTGYTQ